MTTHKQLNGCLIIRADGGSVLGTGHVLRCLALANGWQRLGGQVVFALARGTPALAQRIQQENCSVAHVAAIPGSEADADQTISIARARNAEWMVADSYDFNSDYQRRIKQAGFRLLCVDDFGQAGPYWADLVLNQNLHAGAHGYVRRESHTRLLLGPQYALLRGQFKPWRPGRRTLATRATKVLVTLGGADPDNVTLRVIHILRTQEWQSRNLEVIVVVGGSNPHLQSLRAALAGSLPAFQLLVDVTNMPELMAWAEVAIAAGGTTCWELAFMGLPGLVFVLAENQRLLARALDTAGVVRMTNLDNLSDDLSALLSDARSRRQMSQSGRALVDGDGVDRVLAALRQADPKNFITHAGSPIAIGTTLS
jgi:UDP-2,4-diacetamido-2,4,6-trideoxy-beta-L-altropyranose hydrolase